jgi:pyridoxamine 5'-phosphate oxidase
VNELTLGDFTEVGEPFALFDDWFAAAGKSEPNDPEAMSLATVDADGLPDVRMVLLKGADERGFVFYTNEESAKGRELAASPKAAALFHWKSLRRQIRLRGPVVLVSDEESDAYFKSRARDSRIGAWASQQSRPLESRLAFEKAIAFYAAKFGVGEVPRPTYWRGFRLIPIAMEFWRDRPFRLHDRVSFTREAPGAPWRRQRLYP